MTNTTNNDSGLNLDHLEALAPIGRLIATQDNRITEAPIFVVEQKTPVISDSDYNDCRVEWRETEKGDYQLASPERAARLEELHRAGRDTPGWRRHELTDIWTFVTACFTEQGCIDYLARNGHNLSETRIYAYGSYRNEEFRTVRNALIALARRAAPVSAPTAGEQADFENYFCMTLSCDDSEPAELIEAARLAASDAWMERARRAALANQPAPMVDGVRWDLFPGYLIDHHENEVMTEEGLQHALAGMLKDSQYLTAANQPAPTVPADYVLMPRRLTAENGAKGAMIGEFHEEITVRCPDCDGADEEMYCASCDDEGTVQQAVQVQWDTIKQIYSRAVDLLAHQPAQEQASPSNDRQITVKQASGAALAAAKKMAAECYEGDEREGIVTSVTLAFVAGAEWAAASPVVRAQSEESADARDAARYRWIRKDWVQPDPLCRWVPRHPVPQPSGGVMWYGVSSEANYDAAVDRAMKSDAAIRAAQEGDAA